MLKIHKTTDYSQFKFLKENRDPAPKYMIESIQTKNMLEEHPIICDINMNVLDGQNRLKSAEFLNLPIFYVISENMTADDIILCQVQKPWIISDYLNFNQEDADYKFVGECVRTYGIPMHLVIRFCNPDKKAIDSFKKGKFSIKRSKNELRQKFQQMKDIIQAFSNVKKNSGCRELNISVKVQRVLWSFINKEKYDHKTMMKQIKNYPDNVLPILDFNLESSISKSLSDRLYHFKKGKETRDI